MMAQMGGGAGGMGGFDPSQFGGGASGSHAGHGHDSDDDEDDDGPPPLEDGEK